MPGILDSFRLDGRVALVTGASRGLGRAISIGLAEAGADIAALDILPSEETVSEIEGRGGRALAIVADLGGLDPDRASSIIAEAAQTLGRIDILVNNAGIIWRSAALDYSAADWATVLDVDLTAAFLLSQAAARYFIATGRRGAIINMASMLSFQGGLFVAAYAAAKSGLAGLTRALANEWAPLSINVNAIAPGYMATEVTEAIRTDPERNAAILARIPAGRWGEPEDIVGAAVFLASDAARYIHGTILPVDGGWLTR